MLQKIDHIGIAVHSISQARVFYEQALGLHCEQIEEIPSQQVRTAFFVLGETKIELLEPMNENGPIAKFLQRQGEGVHHIAYRSDNAATQLEKAEKAGCRLINTIPIPGAGGQQIGFLHPKSTHGVLTEICSTGQIPA
ncbi:MAG: methylmalonyl-CoA epimerase [Candidatus Electrothrix sp. GW3-4]|uniref:methylmalonyl-CoA epimerase n=1 Tax=Candidatus Electrothrix sp. GW3-4 TaxID=3126740 RepID=UPI0030CAA870